MAVMGPCTTASPDRSRAPIRRYASEVPDCDLVICPQSVTIAFRVPKSRDAAHLWVTTQQCAVTTGSLDGGPDAGCRHSPGASAVIGRDLATRSRLWRLTGGRSGLLHPPVWKQHRHVRHPGRGAAAVAAGNEVGITGARMCALPLCSAHLCAASSAGTWT